MVLCNNSVSLHDLLIWSPRTSSLTWLAPPRASWLRRNADRRRRRLTPRCRGLTPGATDVAMASNLRAMASNLVASCYL